MADLNDFNQTAAADHGLIVLVTNRADGSTQASVVNAGVIDNPLTGAPAVALVAAGGTRKLANLRADPTIAVVARAGWRWASVEGRAELIGPDDPHPEVDDEQLRLLLRTVFTGAGGTHDDWPTYDRVMAEERRVAVLVTPERTRPAP